MINICRGFQIGDKILVVEKSQHWEQTSRINSVRMVKMSENN